MGIPLNEMVVWDPYMINGGLTNEQMKRAKVILWKGHCSVHQRFLPEHVEHMRAAASGHADRHSSRMPLGGLPEGRRDRFDRLHH